MDDTTVYNGTSPVPAFGQKGDYAVVVTSDNENKIFYKKADNTWTLVQGGFDSGKKVQVSPHTDYPTWTTSTAVTGSVWLKTTTPGLGANLAVKYYNGSTETWTTQPVPMYNSTRQALEKYDYTSGGKNIAVGTLFAETDYDHFGITTATTAVASFKIWRRASSNATSIVSAAVLTTQVATSQFTIRETLASGSAWGTTKTINITGSNTAPIAAQIPAAISAAGLINITATYDATTKKVTISHALGGDFELKDGTKQEFFLDSPDVGLYIPKMCWRTMKYTHNAVQICIASIEYDEVDYIRDYNVFLNY
jgi:hypothetical protein